MEADAQGGDALSFRTGKFDRAKIGWLWRGFAPSEAVNALADIDPEALKARGKTLILLDVDNTLLPWRSEDIPQTTLDWVARAKTLGFDLCILSNTRHPDRLKRLAEKLGIEFLLGRFKPSRHMYLAALKKYQRGPDEAIMIGDQLVTDVLGANRSGIEAIWVKQMADLDFVGTKFNRMMERFMRGFFYRTLPIEAKLEEQMAEATGKPLTERPVVRQFAKFVVVGASSFAIDAGLHYLLMFVVHVQDQPLGTTLGEWLKVQYPNVFGGFAVPSDAAFPVLKVITASLAILNSFFWNRRWTFKIKGSEERARQFGRFVTVSVTGLLLNTFISSALNNIIPAHPRRSWAIATLVATAVVAFWNFTGQRLWAFKKSE